MCWIAASIELDQNADIPLQTMNPQIVSIIKRRLPETGRNICSRVTPVRRQYTSKQMVNIASSNSTLYGKFTCIVGLGSRKRTATKITDKAENATGVL
ncbi:MAG: hypothetical protein IPJ55_07505 [Chloracidobacterium sp.]|nr:hypothetical protein [Chloracidobacterium sp.]